MATDTYVALADYTTTSAVQEITFSNIPTDGTYRDLYLTANYTLNGGLEAVRVRINGDTSTYENTNLYNLGSNGLSGSTLVDYKGGAVSEERAFEMKVFGINVTDAFKSFIATGGTYQQFNTSINTYKVTGTPISSITIRCDLSTFVSGAHFRLFGITATL